MIFQTKKVSACTDFFITFIIVEAQDKTPACWIYLILILLVTGPGIVSIEYFETFSAELPHTHWWQKIISPFQHGAAGEPAAIFLHMSLNLTLLITCGRMTERLIGSKSFTILSLLAWLGFTLTQVFTGVWINGSSGIIWAYSPFLLHFVKNSGAESSKARFLLIIMWGVVTILMTFVPLLFNPTLNFWYAAIFGNIFHLAATLVGLGYYLIWKQIATTRPSP